MARSGIKIQLQASGVTMPDRAKPSAGSDDTLFDHANLVGSGDAYGKNTQPNETALSSSAERLPPMAD
jgi:hypothetical protein